MPPVLHAQRSFDGAEDDLHHAFEAAPGESRAQYRVPADDCLPRGAEVLGVNLAVEPVSRLLDVDARVRVRDRVEEHALLQRRERIDRLNVLCLIHVWVLVLWPPETVEVMNEWP